MTFSRHGRGQLRALGGTTVVVKEPYAALWLQVVSEVTGARPVLVHRHPAACLASYRRVGWSPDLDELGEALRGHEELLSEHATGLVPWPTASALSPAQALGVYRAAINAVALSDLAHGRASGGVVVAHEELASGGPSAAGRLMARLGLQPVEDERARPSGPAPASGPGVTAGDATLHANLDADPATVASAWRSEVDPHELAELRVVAGELYDALGRARLGLGAGVAPDW